MKKKQVIWLVVILGVLFLFLSLALAPRLSRVLAYLRYVNHVDLAEVLGQTVKPLDLTGHAHPPNVDIGYAKLHLPTSVVDTSPRHPSNAFRYENGQEIVCSRYYFEPSTGPLHHARTLPAVVRVNNPFKRFIEDLVDMFSGAGRLQPPPLPVDPNTLIVAHSYDLLAPRLHAHAKKRGVRAVGFVWPV
jgi:hypothetical protein